MFVKPKIGANVASKQKTAILNLVGLKRFKSI